MKYEDSLNVLIGVLRKGQAWVESEYRSSLEIAQEKLIEVKKREIERRKNLEEYAFKIAFDEWKGSCSEIELNNIAEKKKGDLTPNAAKLSIYFRNNIWSSVKSNYIIF